MILLKKILPVFHGLQEKLQALRGREIILIVKQDAKHVTLIAIITLFAELQLLVTSSKGVKSINVVNLA
jgi:hypothetical protein